MGIPLNANAQTSELSREAIIEKALDEAQQGMVSADSREPDTVPGEERIQLAYLSPEAKWHDIKAPEANLWGLDDPLPESTPYYFGPRDRNFDLALQVSSYKYDSEDKKYFYSPTDSVNKNGFLLGLYGSYAWRPSLPLRSFDDLFHRDPFPTFIRLEAEGTTGKLSYDSDLTRKMKNFDTWEIDVRILGGYDFQKDETSIQWTPYVGFGYSRHWDKSGGHVDYFVYSYEEFPVKYSYYYIPVGLEVLKDLNYDWDVRFRVEADFVISGGIEYYLSDIEGTFGGYDIDTGEPLTLMPRNVISDFKGGFGFRTSVKLIRKFEKWNLFLEPHMKFWHINATDPEQAHAFATNNNNDYVSVYPDGSPYKPIWDPKSKTLYFGMRLGFQF